MNLSELIDTHKGRRSYPDLARDCGGVPSAKRLQQLVREPIKNFPDPPTVTALARGLKVPQRVVVLAAAESLGLQVDEAPARVVQLMPTTAQYLTEEQAAAVAHLVDVFATEPDEAVEDAEVLEPIEPTVRELLARERRLRPVATGRGDPSDADVVDELARQARLKQTGQEE